MAEVTYLEDELHGLLPFEQDEISQAYLKYLKDGLPQGNVSSKKILVVGCGIAGMVSAALLRRAGHTVTIVEANTRIGGRIKTFRNSEQKQYFEDGELTGEAGAMRIPDMHKLVQYLIDYTGVEKQLFINNTISKKSAMSEHIKKPVINEQGNIELPAGSGKNLIHVNYRNILRRE